MTNAKLRGGGGGEDYIDISNAFLLARNIIELIDYHKLGGLGACSPRKFLTFQSLRLSLVASETKTFGLRRSISVI